MKKIMRFKLKEAHTKKELENFGVMMRKKQFLEDYELLSKEEIDRIYNVNGKALYDKVCNIRKYFRKRKKSSKNSNTGSNIERWTVKEKKAYIKFFETRSFEAVMRKYNLPKKTSNC